MAEEHSHNHGVITPVEEAVVPAAVETQDRGIFDFLKKDEEKPAPAQADAGEEALVAEFEKVEVSEPKVEEEEEEKIEEVKRESFLEKLHSDSSSSSSDEEEGSEKKEKKKKKKKCLKEKITGEGDDKKSEEDTTVPIEKYEEVAAVAQAEEKKGFLEKIKEKLPGQKKTEEVPAPVMATEVQVEETKEKKGIFEKIKEKLPGYHPKTTEEEKEKERGSDY